MDALTSFIVVIIAITIQFSLYAIKRLQEPLEPNYLIDKDSKKIISGLKKIRTEIKNNKFTFDDNLEDIHMNIERRLYEIIGDEAAYLLTARS